MFNSISIRRPKLNKFDLSHDVKLSCNMGDLVPVFLEEVVPGDRFKVNSEIMMRLAPMLAPIMHRVDVYTHYFFVPNRIVWNEWEDFITGGEDGLQAPTWPHFNADYIWFNAPYQSGTLYDYLGLPPLVNQPAPGRIAFSALPFRGYTEIFNEFYRDQTLTTAISNPKTSGVQSDVACMDLQKRAWEKDYFTSALPFAQRGGAVSVPVDVIYSDPAIMRSTGGTFATGDDLQAKIGGSSSDIQTEGSLRDIIIENLDDAGIDVNNLRRSTAMQRWIELAARGGSRYVEQLLSFFGVRSSDARLQRPEYLGGGKQHVMISEVLQTAETGTTPLGEMAGHGVSVGSTNSFTKRFEEHGYVFGIMSVLPRTAYGQGVPKHWLRSDKFDYYFPQFAHLGEQEVIEDEVYLDPASSTGSDAWGYQSRYAEMKHRSGRFHGDFRNSLDYYHMARLFPSVPGLNQAFIEADPTHRIFANAVTTDHKLWCQIHHKFSALRPMPYYGEPGL